MRPTVLVACDAADDDRSPVAFGRTLARALDARVALVNVRTTERLAGAEADGAPAGARRRLVGTRVLRAASPAAGLQRLIAAQRPLVAVLGSAHDAGYGRLRVGGTAERVLNGAASAVAVVPRGHGERGLGAIGVGLLPNADSPRALHAGAQLARAADTPLLVLIVLQRSPDVADAAALAARLVPGAVFGGTPAEILRAAIIASVADEQVDVEPLVLVGDAADALLRISARVGLVVLGSRAYGPPGIVLPGGAARRVLAGASCPVMLVPRSGARGLAAPEAVKQQYAGERDDDHHAPLDEPVEPLGIEG
jgi:nucleotide-binding universal stress UspA family protein